jgi:VPDSG-CTERM motif
MKHNIAPVRKLALVTVVFCTAMFAFNQNASATRRPLPPSRFAASVPDAGATIVLLGTAFGRLGIARRFLKK